LSREKSASQCPSRKAKIEKNPGEEEIPEQENPFLLRTFINLWLKSQG
jgi:hypothetical protein